MIETLWHLLQHQRPTKYWEKIKLSELSELYISMSLKTFSLSLVAIFIPVYLYGLGYSIATICWFFAGAAALRIVAHFPVAHLIAWRGPKHTLRYSYILLLFLLLLLYSMPEYNWPLWLVAATYGLHGATFFMAYHVDFSKISSHRDSGSQVGKMMIILKVAAGIGPLAGGLIAQTLGIEWTIVFAVGLLLVAIFPLMASGEPVKTHQKLRWSGLMKPKFYRGYLSVSGMGIDQEASILLWPLLMGVFVFQDSAYSSIGFVTSLGFIATIISSRVFGKMSDKRFGARRLLDYSAITRAINHVCRVFVGGIPAVAATSIANDVGMTGTRIPYIKGYYDRVDQVPSQRITLIAIMETFNALSRVLLWTMIALLIPYFGALSALHIGLLFGAVGSLVIMTQDFRTIK